MTRGCKKRAKCGRLEGAALLAQARMGRDQLHPGQLAQKGLKIPNTKALQSRWSFSPWWSLQRDNKCPNPSGTGPPQARGPGDSDRPELEAALLWGCLWDCPRIPVLPMGLPEPARSQHSLSRGTGLGNLWWGHLMAVLQLSLQHKVLCAHSSPLLNSHTLASSLLSNHLHHQTPSHTTTAKPSLALLAPPATG